MTLWPSRRRTGRAAGAALLLATATASAEPIPVATQEAWAGAKERAATGAGVELANVAEAIAMPMHVWQGALEGLAMLDWAPLAPAVEAPTLILSSDEDSLFDTTSQERLNEALPGARLETFAGLGHNLIWEDPQKVAAVVGEFLAE